MNRIISGLIVLFCFVFNSQYAQNNSLILNEIMFYPSEKNGEFIELFNNSSKNIELNNFKIRYETSKDDEIESISGSYTLTPFSFAVIIEGDYDFENGNLKYLIPSGVLILKIKDNSFGRSGMSNSSDKRVYLIKGSSIIDSVKYTAGNKAGESEERIFIGQNLWSHSHVIGGTPGKKNSVSPKEIDGMISLSIENSKVIQNEEFKINFSIKNLGLKTLSNIKINLFLSTTYGTSLKEIYSKTYEQIPAKDSINDYYSYSIENTGKYYIKGVLEALDDENPINNSDSALVNIIDKPLGVGKIFITEIMYNPEDEPEWIELYNGSEREINLKGFYIKDKSKSKRINHDFTLLNGNYVVISVDSSIYNYYPYSFPALVNDLPSLNNGGDIITISDSNSFLLDSLDYTGFITSNNNRSLEKVIYNGENDSLNWKYSESPLKATPGKVNSVSPKENDLQIEFIREEKKYFVGNKNKIFIRLSNKGEKDCNNITVNLDKLESDKYKTLWDTTISYIGRGDSLKLIYNNDNLDVGDNFFRVELFNFNDDYEFNNTDTINIKGYKRNCFWKDLVITEFMSDPLTGNPEWIEFYNRSNKEFSLNGFMISDNRDTIKLKTKKIIKPGNFIVVAEDTITELANIDYIISNIPSLNNSRDEIKIIDNYGFLIDSIMYIKEEMFIKGGSHEKVDITDVENSALWLPYKYGIGGTPGKINSNSIKKYDFELSKLKISPEYPSPKDSITIDITVKNIGASYNQGNLIVFDDEKEIFRKNSIALTPGDSINIEVTYNNNFNTKLLKAFVECFNDEDTLNNSLEKKIIYSYEYNSVIISEFNPYPAENNTEWIELYNNSSQIINLKKWKFYDKSETKAVYSEKDLFLYESEYIVIASDSSIFNCYDTIPSRVLVLNLPGLNNSEEVLLLKDSLNVVIDSVNYDDSWNIRKGYSIERKNYNAGFSIDNMGFSEDRNHGTPGRINSICSMEHDVLVDSVYTLPLYPSEDEKVNVCFVVKNRGVNNEHVKYQIRINNSLLEEGELTVSDTLVFISSKQLPFKDSTVINVILFLSTDENIYNNYLSITTKTGEKRGAVKISELMIDSEDGSEWVELVNTTDKTINLKNWSFTDIKPQINFRKINKDIKINPDEFFVITNMELKIDVQQYIDKTLSLSNINDGFIVCDSRGAVIDSFYYDESYKIIKNNSLERIDITGPTNDYHNWHFSITGNSCGKENSVNNFFPLSYGDIKLNEILYDSDSTKSEFIEIKNCSNKEIDLSEISLFINSNLIYPFRNTLVLEPDSLFVITNDPLLKDKYNIYKNNLLLSPENFSLPNNEGNIVIIDYKGTTIDSLSYNNHFHNPEFLSTKNISLERINSDLETNYKGNWTSSVSNKGATPCYKNSSTLKLKNNAQSISIEPNPFSPDNDGFEDVCFIRVKSNKLIESINALIFDDKGRLLRRIKDFSYSSGELTIVFNGLDDKNNRLKIGIYILYLDVVYIDGTKDNFKKLIVLAHKL